MGCWMKRMGLGALVGMAMVAGAAAQDGPPDFGPLGPPLSVPAEDGAYVEAFIEAVGKHCVARVGMDTPLGTLRNDALEHTLQANSMPGQDGSYAFEGMGEAVLVFEGPDDSCVAVFSGPVGPTSFILSGYFKAVGYYMPVTDIVAPEQPDGVFQSFWRLEHPDLSGPLSVMVLAAEKGAIPAAANGDQIAVWVRREGDKS